MKTKITDAAEAALLEVFSNFLSSYTDEQKRDLARASIDALHDLLTQPHMQPSAVGDSRAQFEAWVQSLPAQAVQRDDDEYTVAASPSAWEGWQAALAATGTQQVGTFPWENFPAYLIDKCEGDTISEEGIQRAVADMAKDARYCQQQVGEVQEVVPYSVARDLLADAYNAGRNGIGFSEQVMRLDDALAARQPVGQEPVCFVSPGDADHLRLQAVTLRHVATYWKRPGDDAVPVYLGQPAQAVDLGQFREAVNAAWKASMVGSEVDLKLGKLLALIDGQRDEAKAVDRG